MSFAKRFSQDTSRKEREFSDMELLRFFVGFLRPYSKLILAILVILVFGSLLAILNPLILKIAIDNYIIPKRKSELWKITTIFLLVVLSTWIADIARIFLISYLGQRTIYDIRNDTFEKLIDLSMDFYESEESGRLTSILTNDIDTIADFLRNGLTDIVANMMRLIGLIAIMFWLSPGLTVVTLLVTPLVGIIFYYLRKYARGAYRAIRQSVARLTSKLAETINGILVIKVYAQEERLKDEFSAINEENYSANIKQNAIVSLILPSIKTLSSTAILLIIAYALWRNQVTGQTEVSVGLIVAFIRYEGMLFDPILSLTMFYSLFQSALAALERVKRISNKESSVKESENSVIPSNPKGKIEIDDVWFSYDGERTYALKGITLRIAPGESVALVGHTGAGKTTLGKLVLRYYDPTRGSIRLDGIELKNLSLDYIGQHIVLVPQDPFLFNASIVENIRFGNPNASMDQILRISRLIGLDKVVEKLPEGYNSIVGPRGVQLSQGEKQLLSFARALVSNPLVIVLDEATASVDPFTEYEIQKATETVLECSTTIVIAHRLSTLKNVDRIVVLENGEITEEGTWSELIRLKGAFYDYYRAQVLSEMKGIIRTDAQG